MIDKSKIQSVYSGRNGRCCCGCAGKHTYASTQRAMAENRGGSVSDRTVSLICNKIDAAGAIEDGNHFYAIVDRRLYVAYKIES